ncbi:MAG: hypothetical protein COB67_01500 [SAR324 cluster bacterium]|uniref:histidine kinase n=1 Tax=SAR324 cluster bacterium TaxID=2024889 RepID=A0A2A4TAT4_9DELT|nr:MAG: hypothetical protein COB67_01500 [SAR324 cluster bacterium]
MRILVVDDSAMMRKIIRRELEKGGYEVFEAGDGVECLEIIENVQPHLITMDVDMPRMNGYEAVYKIRSEIKPLSTEISHKVPIIFITANDTLEGRSEGFESGASDFITKPFLQGEVLTAVNELVKPKNSLKGLTAVIAEDNQMARQLLNSILKSEGINTILTASGAEAFDVIKSREADIDLLITDYMMPGMNGDELCRKVRLEMGNKTLPIIFLSAMSERSSILELFKAGASDYVIKPFAKEELMSRIRVHLEARLLNRKLTRQVQDLKRLSKLQNDFLAVTSHDLRAPLNGILGFTDLLLQEDDIRGEHKEYLTHVKDSGNFLLNLINDILDLGRVQSENEEIELEDISIEAVLNSSTNTVRHMASPKDISLETYNKCKQPIFIKGHQSSLIRVFNNILSNAIKFTPRGGWVKQIVEPMGTDKVAISFIDNGIGIPTEKIPLLFEKFSKTSRPGTAGEKGTGLGLSITKELIERHEGTVDVTSEVGKGTCFRLIFPLNAGSIQPSEEKIEEAEHSIKVVKKSIDIRFLLVDDNYLNIKLASTVLKQKGYIISSARDGKSALDQYVESLKNKGEGETFDMIFMDLRMPTMDGYESTYKIREFEQQTGLASIPIIAMSAGTSEEEKQRCQEVGMNGFVNKPINLKQIQSVIQEFIQIQEN